MPKHKDAIETDGRYWKVYFDRIDRRLAHGRGIRARLLRENDDGSPYFAQLIDQWDTTAEQLQQTALQLERGMKREPNMDVEEATNLYYDTVHEAVKLCEIMCETQNQLEAVGNVVRIDALFFLRVMARQVERRRSEFTKRRDDWSEEQKHTLEQLLSRAMEKYNEVYTTVLQDRKMASVERVQTGDAKEDEPVKECYDRLHQLEGGTCALLWETMQSMALGIGRPLVQSQYENLDALFAWKAEMYASRYSAPY